MIKQLSKNRKFVRKDIAEASGIKEVLEWKPMSWGIRQTKKTDTVFYSVKRTLSDVIFNKCHLTLII